MYTRECKPHPYRVGVLPTTLDGDDSGAGRTEGCRLRADCPSDGFDRCGQLLHRLLRVTEEHYRLRVQEERILDPGEPRAHAALQHDDLLRLVDVQDRHPV